MAKKEDHINWDEKKKKIPKIASKEDHTGILKEKNDLPADIKSMRQENEIDLHFEKIMEKKYHDDFSSKEKLELQIETFKEFLDKAIKYRMKSIIIIHGFGNGVLKKEIYKVLQKQKQFATMHDASYRNFGMGGASRVEFNFK